MSVSDLLSILFGYKQPELVPVPVKDNQQKR